ncbi:hypothetical protein DPMN_156520 [Dreissena polymorpha]|uniref:Uncharacterized protein n=1 Tax=Dreissena polymorpha TaxID=45954 RepID=A0A9D4FUI1_DREPO|nr:hypothetical protein DPMN_156520 [Dreissena polymorpha]
MARQRPTLEIDRIVIREVQYQLEVNRCRNEEIIVKGNFGWALPMWAGRPRVGNGAMHKVQYQFEVNRYRNKEIIVKGNFGWAWPMWAGRPGINHIVIREVQYQFEVNRCRNEEVIVKGNFGWAWPLWAGRLRIDHIFIRGVQYQFVVNRCRNEEIIVKGNMGWAWPMSAGRPRVGNVAMYKVQYQFEDNRCRNEEIMFQGSSAKSLGGDSGQDGRTDGRTAEIITISISFSKSVGIKTIVFGCGLLWAGRPRIDRIVIRDVQCQLKVIWCRNEEIIEIGNFGWAWPMWPGFPRVGNGAIHINRCRNEEVNDGRTDGRSDAHHHNIPTFSPKIIDRIVIREVRYQFEDNRCSNEEIIFQVSSANRRTDRRTAAEITTISPRFSKSVGIKTILGACGLLWAGRPRIDRIVIRDVPYQFEVNRLKGNFGWAWPMWAECLRIDRIVIRVVQYQFEVNPCRNEEIIVKGNFGWAWPMWAGRPRIDRIFIRAAQYQFEVNRCRNEEFQGSSANRRTDGQTHISTISPLFLRKTWG